MNIMAMRWQKLYRSTPSELSIEDAVASLGVPYRSQFPGYLYGVRAFPDFYLPTLALVIEVDDKSHDYKGEEDEERTQSLRRAWGVQVVRCTNKEALNNPVGAVRAMLSSVGLWPLPSRLPALAASLPVPKKAAKKLKREAKAQQTQARRQGSRRRLHTADQAALVSAALQDNQSRAEALRQVQVTQVEPSASP